MSTSELTEEPAGHRPTGPVAGAAEGELADVVVSAVPLAAGARHWGRALRVWLFCLGFLLCAEAAARVAFDHSLVLRHERFDAFPNPAAQDTFVGQMARDRAYRVVVVGDSVAVGTALLKRHETLPEQLEKVLAARVPGHRVHVWNYSIAGGRALDQYCLVASAMRARPDFLVVSANYFIVAGGNNAEAPLNHPWLLRSLTVVPPEIAADVPQMTFKERVDATLGDLVERNVRIIGMRQAAAACVLGMQPRYPYTVPNPAVTLVARAAQRLGKVKSQSWRDRGQPLRDWMTVFKGNVGPDNRNAKAYGLVRQQLEASGVPSFTYLTPQNPTIVAISMPREQFATGRARISSFLRSPSVPHADLSEAVPDQWFQDHNHLLPEGNRLLAERLADYIAPAIARDLEARRHQASTTKVAGP